MIGTLSKGFRQRVGLAQAIVHEPPVLILDEPTVGLDPLQIQEIRGLISDLADPGTGEAQHTVVLSTHILPEVEAICRRVILINEGRKAVDAPLSELTAGFERFPQVLVNVQVAQKKPIESLPGVQSAIADVEAKLGDRGRVLIRYSGTEPLARIMVEGEDEESVQSIAQQLADELARALAA